MKEYFLVSFNDNYADEFDISGFSVFCSKQELNEWKDSFPDGEFRYGFGSNESITYNSKQELMHHFSTEKITETQANVLSDLFGNLSGVNPYGFFPCF